MIGREGYAIGDGNMETLAVAGKVVLSLTVECRGQNSLRQRPDRVLMFAVARKSIRHLSGEESCMKRGLHLAGKADSCSLRF
jgi:hypothetical protein